MFKFITHRPLWLNMLTGVLLAVAILFIFIFSLNWLTHHDESKTVPSVAGKSFEEAEEILEKAGFEVEIQDSIYVDTVKPLKVLRQVPEADEMVKVNRTVYLTINRASAKAERRCAYRVRRSKSGDAPNTSPAGLCSAGSPC